MGMVMATTTISNSSLPQPGRGLFREGAIAIQHRSSRRARFPNFDAEGCAEPHADS